MRAGTGRGDETPPRVGQQRLDGIRLDRPGEHEALAGVAPLEAQPLELHVVLDALGQGEQSERPSELDERVDERGRVGRAVHLRDERPVDLEHVHRELPEVGQRRVAGAEVVDGDEDAELLEAP